MWLCVYVSLGMYRHVCVIVCTCIYGHMHVWLCTLMCVYIVISYDIIFVCILKKCAHMVPDCLQLCVISTTRTHFWVYSNRLPYWCMHMPLILLFFDCEHLYPYSLVHTKRTYRYIFVITYMLASTVHSSVDFEILILTAAIGCVCILILKWYIDCDTSVFFV